MWLKYSNHRINTDHVTDYELDCHGDSSVSFIGRGVLTQEGGHLVRILDAVLLKKCSLCKCSNEDGHFDHENDICSIAERGWSEMATSAQDARYEGIGF